MVDSIATFDRNGNFSLRFDAATDTNFMFSVRPGSGADVTVDTGVACDTNYHTFLVYSTTTGTIRMMLDGGTEKTFCASGCDGTATIPTSQMDPLAQLVTSTGSGKIAHFDAFKFRARVGTGAANRRN